MAAPESNTWIEGRWYGPSYPDAGEPPAPVYDGDAAGEDLTPELDELEPDDPAHPEPGALQPPKVGSGSSRKAWETYATAHGVTVTADENRDDIIAACVAAGITT